MMTQFIISAGNKIELIDDGWQSDAFMRALLFFTQQTDKLDAINGRWVRPTKVMEFFQKLEQSKHIYYYRYVIISQSTRIPSIHSKL